MQKSGKIDNGRIKFQKIKPVMTDCLFNQNNMDHSGNVYKNKNHMIFSII